jgi:hypothetical protein
VIVVTSQVLAPSQHARLAGASKILSKFDLTTEVLVGTIRDVVNKDRAA